MKNRKNRHSAKLKKPKKLAFNLEKSKLYEFLQKKEEISKNYKPPQTLGDPIRQKYSESRPLSYVEAQFPIAQERLKNLQILREGIAEQLSWKKHKGKLLFYENVKTEKDVFVCNLYTPNRKYTAGKKYKRINLPSNLKKGNYRTKFDYTKVFYVLGAQYNLLVNMSNVIEFYLKAFKESPNLIKDFEIHDEGYNYLIYELAEHSIYSLRPLTDSLPRSGRLPYATSKIISHFLKDFDDSRLSKKHQELALLVIFYIIESYHLAFILSSILFQLRVAKINLARGISYESLLMIENLYQYKTLHKQELYEKVSQRAPDNSIPSLRTSIDFLQGELRKLEDSGLIETRTETKREKRKRVEGRETGRPRIWVSLSEKGKLITQQKIRLDEY